jgi:glycosyltransferase involved in cell wall biosynthesis
LAIFSNADVLVANTDAVAERWRAQYPQYGNKITHIWNGFDPEELIGPLAIPPRYYRQLAHVGEIYGGRHPGLLLDALVRLRRALAHVQPFKVELIGEIDRGTLPNAAVLAELERDGLIVVSPPAHSSSHAAQIMAEADALLLIDWAGYSAGLQVPSKLYVYLRIGRPILAITTKDSPVDRILQQSGIAFTCLYPDDSHSQIDAKVLTFLGLPSEARYPTPWFIENFDGRHQIATLARLLRPTVKSAAGDMPIKY